MTLVDSKNVKVKGRLLTRMNKWRLLSYSNEGTSAKFQGIEINKLCNNIQLNTFLTIKKVFNFLYTDVYCLQDTSKNICLGNLYYNNTKYNTEKVNLENEN